VFDKADSDRIRQSLLDYERAAVTEWPVAASGHSFPEADNALQRLYTAYTQVQPRTDIQTKFLATSLGNLDKMSQARTERVLQARTDVGPPWSLWAVRLWMSPMLTSGVPSTAPGWYPADPNRATNDAASMAKAMLAKVKV
jgi:hypothetical protein